LESATLDVARGFEADPMAGDAADFKPRPKRPGDDCRMVDAAGLMEWPAPADNAAMSNAHIERERLTHDVKLLVAQLAELEAEYKWKREELLRLFAKFGGKPPEPTPKST
jgi:hypothetical protein